MKRILSVILLIGILSTAFVGCSSKPTIEEIVQAVEEGKLTFSDAIEKGYLTEKDVDEYRKENGLIEKAVNKVVSAPKLNSFTTTDTNGEEVTQEIFKNGENGVYVVFWDTSNEDAIKEVNELNEIYETAIENKYEIVGIVVDKENAEAAKEIAKDIKFKNVLFNDEMKKSLANGLDMLENLPISVYSNSNGDLITAWHGGVTDKEELTKDWAKSYNYNKLGE